MHNCLLEKHKERHLGIKRYVCKHIVDNKECGKKFADAGSLQSHLNIHSGLKQFVCTFETKDGVCNKRFTQKNGLNIHKRIHGEKKFICNFPLSDGCCTSAFAYKDKMLVHQITHTGEKRFKCKDENCGQNFATSTHMNRHFQRWHSPEGVLTHQTKEHRLFTVLKNASIPVERNVMVDYSCILGATTANATSKVGTRAYLDFVIYATNYVAIIECDEHQHSEDYSPWPYTLSCELARMTQVQTALTISSTLNSNNNVMPILWIRFNPDKFFVDGVSQGKTIIRSKREKRLLEVLNSFEPQQLVTVIYMFYDCNTINGKKRPIILDDEDYNEEFAKCVIDPIVE